MIREYMTGVARHPWIPARHPGNNHVIKRTYNESHPAHILTPTSCIHDVNWLSSADIAMNHSELSQISVLNSATLSVLLFNKNAYSRQQV